MDAAGHERALVLRAQSGDRNAFDQLLRAVDRSLLAFIRTIVGSRTPAEDVLQDVLVTIVRKIAWLRDPGLFRAWSFRIASRASFRAMRGERPMEPLDDSAGETVDPPDPWLRQRLAEALPRVTPASRAVLHLHYVEEMPLSDVAAVLEVRIGTVKSRLAYGLAQLRKELS